MEAKKQVKYILAITLIVVSIFVIFLVFKSNQIMNNMNASETAPTKVLILTTDRLNDQSWGSLAYKGKILIEEEYNVTAEVLGEINAERDTSSLVEQYVEEGYELIIGHGREFSEPFYRIINQYKNVQFVTLHGDNIAKNLAVYTFNQNEIEVIAGMAAGLKTKSNKIGLIDAVDNSHKDWGFSKGIELIDDSIELLYKVVPERTSKSAAKLVAAELIDQGVDVIYTKGNSYNQEVINYAKEQGIYTIGYLEDQSYMAENKVLTSVLNNVPMAYNAILEDFLSEEGIKFEKKYLDDNDGVYGIAPFGPMFSEDEIELIEEATDYKIPR
ncbi:BMP family ABC transporter substrate-binding protein [Gracilibacillus thailandensis]|jgi:transcriptional activator of comK gene|uniref:BMP family ABC transporter substrate-binding protein n=1 Tax=Gracilibacillus thailandensis TaxID=563735 RepID=A0A6N7R3K0_9BACI|nr:BMP family ABC transporter substrate-binding protein [Gracilibacillus thailandensis]MRI67785.1 BMP family ABC transporter substrate-binding protein [Gracilibacillus thailandensis]